MKKTFLILPILAIVDGEIIFGWFKKTYTLKFKKEKRL
jgi:hypothetical protein